jgi:hypothetical protein
LQQDANYLTRLIGALKKQYKSDNILEIIEKLRSTARNSTPLSRYYFFDENFNPIDRDPNTRQFPNDKLAEYIHNATESVAGAFGGKAVPAVCC